MLYPIISLVIGLIVLVWSADKFILGAAGSAKNFGMSPLLIGLTIVAFGTSAPEILVAIVATMDDSGTLAIGNALGSNIANIALVLGVTALIAPLPVKKSVRKKELPLMILVTVIAGAVLYNYTLDTLDSVMLFGALVICLVIFSRTQNDDVDSDDEEIPDVATGTGIFWLIIGLALLIASSKAIVWGATDIAQALGVSDLVVGLTIVAIGTSLPELAASITSALKGHHDIAIGGVVGSNIFNLGAVLAIPGLVTPISFASEIFSRDYLFMLALSVLLLIFCFTRKTAAIKRPEGVFLLALYSGYMAFLYFSSVSL
ncbi:MAG: cation:H+ antiporter [Oceanospirillaceae bacterium]|jgi:cation:H+ antiporter